MNALRNLAKRQRRIEGDGFGALSFARAGIQNGASDGFALVAPDGTPRTAAPEPRVVFGPTCDSLDRVPGTLDLPGDAAEGDYLLFAGMGAYSLSIATRFNGYGLGDPVTVAEL